MSDLKKKKIENEKNIQRLEFEYFIPEKNKLTVVWKQYCS